MKGGLLAAGIIMMVIGAGGFLYVQQSLSDCQSFFGQLGRTFYGEMEQTCQTANLTQIGGAALFIVGIGLTIGGAMAKGR